MRSFTHNQPEILARVMQALNKSEKRPLKVAEISELLPDLAVLQKRLQNLPKISASIAGVELSPHLTKLLKMSDCRGALGKPKQKLAVGHS
ncbi:MAG: hypothetical protein JXA52_01005 [Planctomycetes bacterium]|nr:hypothetical protein [Planctomycetota bacterium]